MKRSDHLHAAIEKHFSQQLSFLQRLVRAKSANPFTPDTSLPDAPIEADVAKVIRGELIRLGFQADVYGVSPQRPNVVCHVVERHEQQKTLILTTHMDTVEPANYTFDPWEARIAHGRLYGLGATDAKAQIAAFIYALHGLLATGVTLHGNVTLAFVVDEETGACSPYGTQYLLEQGIVRGDAAIVGEPGNDKIATGHRGLYRFRIRVLGEATHTGMRAWEEGTKGHSAAVDFARITLALSSYTFPQMSSAAFPRRKNVLTFPTLFNGGSNINVVPASCEGYGEARLLPGTTAEDIKKIIHAQIALLGVMDYQLDDIVSVPAAETSPQERVIQSLAQAAYTVTGSSPRLEGSGPACDGWMFTTRGIPTVCGYGVGGGNAHSADEWADIESLRTVTEIYAHAIMRYFEE